MAQGQFQLEKVIDEVLQDGDVQSLEVFIQRNTRDGIPVKCSLQFLTKLDKLVSRSLEQNDMKSAGLGLAVLYKCGNNLKLPGGRQGLSGMIAQGLLKKWMEKCRQLWIQCGPQWDEALFNLSEDFFDALMVVHEACKKGTCKVTESFLYPVGQLAVDSKIYILIQKEAIRRFNLILDKIPEELKREKKIVTSQEASDIMIKLAGQIVKGGDYDLQTALMEALCRMATPDQRKELAESWFSMEHVASAFVKICDAKFETDCRKFLNFVNGMQGDKRRVYSYPCLEVYLDKHELLMPADEKLEEFWIDFNLDSHSISFYFSFPDDDAQDSQWETICINENEVQSYSVTEEGKRKVLQVMLSEVVVVGAVEGSRLIILFSSSLDILQAAATVYGPSKNKDFVGKTSTSVVSTTIKVVMEDNLSQVVPESQMSLNESERNTAIHLLPTPSAPGQMGTPTRRRVSESTTFISGSGGGSVHGATLLSAVMSSNTSVKGKGRPSLEMVRSSDRRSEFYLRELRTTAKTFSNGTTSKNTTAGGLTEQSTAFRLSSKNVGKQKKSMPLAKAVDGQGEELEPSVVPDTQPTTERNIPFNWNKLSVSEMLMMPTQKINLLPKPEPHSSLAKQQERPSSAQRPISPKLLHRELTQRLQQVLSEQNQDPQTLMSDVREDPEGRSSADRCASPLCSPKDQQPQRNGLAKGKNEGQMLVETDIPATKAPAKASTTKVLQKRGTPGVKRQADIVGSMVKLISSHYELNTQSTAKDTAGGIPKSWIPPIVSRPIFNMSWSSAAKREVSGAGSQMKSHSRITTNSQRKDIFAFDIDAPLSFGVKNKTSTNTPSTSSSGMHNSSALPSTTKGEQPVVKKEKRYVKKHLFSETDYTSTDVSWLRESNRRPKPKVTKYSKQASVRPKAVSPCTSYESPGALLLAQKHVKGNTKPDKKKLNMKERVKQPKQTVKTASPTRPGPAGRRPQRTAAISTKSYREPDTDESQSEKHPVPKNSSAHYLENDDKTHKAAQVTKKNTASKQTIRSRLKAEISRHSSPELVSEQPLTSRQKHFVGQQGKSERTCLEAPEVKKRKNGNAEPSGDSYRGLESSYQSDGRTTSGVKQRPETSKLNKENFNPYREQMNGLKDSWTARQTSFCPSPPFIERMRSAERSAPTLSMTCSPFPASPDPPEDIPSPVLLLPKPHSAVSSKGNLRSSSSTEKNHSSSKTRSIQSVPSLSTLTPIGQTSAPKRPRAAKISPVQQHLPSEPQSPLSLSSRPLLTSTLLELDKPSMPSPHRSPFPEDTVNRGSRYGFSKVSSASWISLSQSSTKSSVLTERVKDRPAALAVSKTEKTPSSDQDGKSEQLHVSGPSRKRHLSASSNSEEDEKEERKKSKKMRGKRSPRMKPRKLFKSFAEVSAEGELSREVSPSHTMNSRRWEAEVDDGDMDEEFESLKTSVNPSNLCQQFSSELKKKFQNRYNMVEVFNKQSFKAVQQHVSSLNTQVTKHRAQRLEQVQKILLEEIQLLEQNDTVLKDMEKNLTVYWKSQTMAFHSFQERETLRNEALKKALRSNVCHSLEYEERMFTSQMCLIRNDMKSIQDRLLSEMHEGEIQSVKRGLHALFFP